MEKRISHHCLRQNISLHPFFYQKCPQVVFSDSILQTSVESILCSTGLKTKAVNIWINEILLSIALYCVFRAFYSNNPMSLILMFPLIFSSHHSPCSFLIISYSRWDAEECAGFGSCSAGVCMGTLASQLLTSHSKFPSIGHWFESLCSSPDNFPSNSSYSPSLRPFSLCQMVLKLANW